MRTRDICVLTIVLVWSAAQPALAQIPTDAVAFWKLDGNATDSSSSGANDGTAMGTPVWAAARLSTGLELSGDDEVLVPGNGGITGLQPTAYAISAWVKYKATDTNGADVVSMGDHFGLRVQTTGEVKTYFYTGPTNGWRQTQSTVKTNDNAWHHILGQYDTSTHLLQVYVDGNLSGPGASYTDSISYSGLGADLHLGKHGNGSTLYDFNGTVDHVRVYGHALSATEIAALATDAPGGTSFKVLTWNLRKGRATDDGNSIDNTDPTQRVSYWAASTGADVLLFSAVQNVEEARMIQTQMGAGWNLCWAKASDTTEGQAILSHFPMSSCPNGLAPQADVNEVNCLGDSENQVIVRALVTIGTKDIMFFAVDQQDGGSLSGVRQCQAAAFRDWANAYIGLRIIGGDFNAVPGDAGITTWQTPANPMVPELAYTDGWGTAPGPNKDGYPDEGSAVGNNAGNSIYGRTRSNRIDYILRSKESSSNLTITGAKMWDMREPGTTCNMIRSNGFIGGACSGDCSTCAFVEDKSVRPTDHIPHSITFVVF